MQEHSRDTIRVGSRKSELALIQTKHVIERLQSIYPDQTFEIHTMSTMGDRVLNISLPKIGEKSLFTRDLEDSLRDGGVDFVVHSLKDLPTALPPGMAIGAVLEREDARDALVLRKDHADHTIRTLPNGSVIGTSSLRRSAQIRRHYPHLTVCDIRGNLNTRLAKLDAPNSKFAGIILAQAGLVRMGWMSRISQVLEPTDMLYAVGQGALAVECRANDRNILQMLQQLMCLSTTCRILAERSFLKTLGGGCSAPVAVWSKLDRDDADVIGTDSTGLAITGAVWSLDGATEIREKTECLLVMENAKEEKAREKTTNDDEDKQPPAKRARTSTSISSLENEIKPVSQLAIINDDTESLPASYDMEKLLETHINLAKQCATASTHDQINQTNNNIITERGGGDADTLNQPSTSNLCPLQFDIGQDFMGKCPFVNTETNALLVNAQQCPIAHSVTTATTNAANVAPAESGVTASTSKCPFSGKLHEDNNGTAPSTKADCPFLQKNIKMLNYADDEKPPLRLSAVQRLSEELDNIFCGLYQHDCYKRELYERCTKIGQQLADKLIKQGALDIMKHAQAQVHGKS